MEIKESYEKEMRKLRTHLRFSEMELAEERKGM